MPLAVLDEASSLATIRYSSRSRYGFARFWMNPDLDPVLDMPAGGWRICTAAHGGNGSNQGDLDWGTNSILLELANNHDTIIVGVDYGSSGFFKRTATDPRGFYFPDNLVEHAEIWAFMQRNFDQDLLGNSAVLTRDPNLKACFGVSHGGWAPQLMAFLPHFTLPSGFQPTGHSKYRITGDDWRPNNAISSIGHLNLSNFWMAKKLTLPDDSPDPDLADMAVVGSYSAGATDITVASVPAKWAVGQCASILSDVYLVTAIAGNVVTVWPALKASLTSSNFIVANDLTVGKYAEDNYSWAGAIFFDAHEGNNWQTWDINVKRQADLLTYLVAENPRVYDAALLMVHPGSGYPFITNDSDPVSGAAAVFDQSGPNYRYQTLHSEGNAFACRMRLESLGLVQGTDFLMRAGGAASNPDASTRYDADIIHTDISGFLATKRGW